MKYKKWLVAIFTLCFSPPLASAQNKVVVIPLNSSKYVSGGVNTVTSAGGQVWMDRNLGALRVATKSADPDSYGDLYQWGRGADRHHYPTSSTTSVQSGATAPSHGSFIAGNLDWLSLPNTTLWQGESGTNNPCPAGFRLPTEAEWELERASWSSNDSAGAFSSPLKLPAAGYRSNSSGTLYNAGSYGDYWSATVSGSSSRYLYFGSGSALMYSGLRAHGRSVRCLEE